MVRSHKSFIVVGVVLLLVVGVTGGAMGSNGVRSAVGSSVGQTLVEAPDVGGPPFPIGTFFPAHLTFSAVERPDGEVSGNGMAHLIGGSPDFMFTVECVSFDGNQAWIGTRVTKTAFPIPEVGGFWVQDNGEGAHADPDLISSFNFTQGLPGGQDWCDLQPDPTEKWAIEHGSFQVHS